MITLTVNNSVSSISGLSPLQAKQLSSTLTYYVPRMSIINYNDPRSKRCLLSKRSTFPSGLLYLIRDYIVKHKLQCKVIDNRVRPIKRLNGLIGSFTHVPRPEQLEAANAAIKANRGIICAVTGSGKSLIIALIINQLKLKTLVVVPSLELKKQLTVDFINSFGACSVGKGKAVEVANVDSLDPKEVSSVDCVIIDEFHHSGAKTYRDLNNTAWKNVYHKFGLTATPWRSQNHERLLLEGVLSKVIYEIPYQTAVDKGYIVPMEAYYYELPKVNVEGYTWAQVYKELVVENKHRNEIIKSLLRNLKANRKSTLCLVKEINHGAILGFEFVRGDDETSRELINQFNLRAIDVLVGTEGIIGEGIDTKPCEYVIIAGLGKSKAAFMQKIGRAFRRYPGKESCKIILFNDKSHKWTRAHFREQCKILKEQFNIIPIKLD